MIVVLHNNNSNSIKTWFFDSDLRWKSEDCFVFTIMWFLLFFSYECTSLMVRTNGPIKLCVGTSASIFDKPFHLIGMLFGSEFLNRFLERLEKLMYYLYVFYILLYFVNSVNQIVAALNWQKKSNRQKWKKNSRLNYIIILLFVKFFSRPNQISLFQIFILFYFILDNI